jgi:hypothetical protein
MIITFIRFGMHYLPTTSICETARDCSMWSFIIFNPHQIMLGLSNQAELDGRNRRNALGRRQILTAFWLENVKKIINLEDLII